MTTTTATAIAVKTNVKLVPKLNAAPELRRYSNWSQVPMTLIGGWSLRWRDDEVLRQLVEHAPPRAATPNVTRTRCRLPVTAVGVSRTSSLTRREGTWPGASPTNRGQRRSSSCLHDMQSVARGKACSRSLPIGLPQRSQTP